MITKLTFAMFLLKLGTLCAAIFRFVSLVLSLLCGRSTGVIHYCFFCFSIRYQTLISDIDTFRLALFIVSLDLKSKVIKVLFMKAVVL